MTIRIFRSRFTSLLTAAFLVALLCSCDASIIPSPTPFPTITATIPPSPTPGPTHTPTPQPLGSPENPIVMGIVLPATADASASQAAEAVAAQLSKATGYSIKSEIKPNYVELLFAMDKSAIHFAWLPPLTYLYAADQKIAEIGLITNHYGVYSYASQFLANVESNFTVYYDLQKHQSTADAANALRQFAGKRPCWVDPSSPSGYVVPIGTLKSESIDTLPGVMSQDHISVIRSLYAKGICDFGATYGGSGDPRTATALQEELPNVLSKVVIVWQTEPVIPNLNVSFVTGMPQAIRAKVMDALLAMVKTQDGKTSLSNANQYAIGEFKVVDDSFYQPFRNLVKASGIALDTLVGK